MNNIKASMVQIVNTLLKDVNECHKTLNTLTDAEESAKFQGRIESLENAIKQIKEAMEQSSRKVDNG